MPQKPKKKIYLRIAIALIAVPVVAFVGIWFSLNSLVSVAIREGGSRALGVKVDVDSVSILPLLGSVSIRGLRVHNPPGFAEALALRMGKLHTRIDIGALRRGVLDVGVVEVKGAEVWYEKTGAANNFTRIQQGAMQAKDGGGSGSGGGSASRGGKKSATEFRLREFRMLDTKVHLVDYLPVGGRQEVALPDIVLTNLHKKSQAELVATFTAMITANVAKSAAKLLGDPLKKVQSEVLEKGVGEAGKALKGLF